MRYTIEIKLHQVNAENPTVPWEVSATEQRVNVEIASGYAVTEADALAAALAVLQIESSEKARVRLDAIRAALERVTSR